MRSRVLAVFVLAVWAGRPTGVAHAAPPGTVDIVRVGHGANLPITMYGGGLAGEEMYAGVYVLSKTAHTGVGSMWPNGLVSGWCIEIEEPAPSVTKTYDVINVADNYSSLLGESLGTTKANYMRELWGRYYDPAWEGLAPHTYSQNNAASAFAAALWEIMYEDLPTLPWQWDVSVNGTPGIAGYASTTVDAGLANAWLHSLNGAGPKADLRVFTQHGSQNFLVEVPEPTTVILIGFGGAVTLWRRRHR